MLRKIFSIKQCLLLVLFTCVCGEVSIASDSQVVESGAQHTDDSVLVADWAMQARAFRNAQKKYQQQIRSKWHKAIISNQTQWVEYDDGFNVRRMVDFEQNQIRISMKTRVLEDQLDLSGMNSEAKQHLHRLLSTTINQALSRDPVLQSIPKGSSIKGYGSDELVLGELFETNRPSDNEIKSVGEKLFKKSWVSYQEVASVSSVKIKENTTYVIPLPDDRILKKAKKYKPMVLQESREQSLSASLMLAIIHTESHFNPLAQSRIPAFGLMQVVPGTAGRDATKKIFNKPTLLSAEYLFNPKNNLKVGMTYFNLLYFQYFSEVKNANSRMYLSIAAYNGGITAVAKAFHPTGRLSDALPVINDLNDQVLLQRLRRDLASLETRNYLKKVLTRRSQYRYI